MTPNESIPQLISFPRTGSHWLRVLLEEYSNRPLKGRSFKWHLFKRNYLLSHSHDNELTEQTHKVIYLYRDPIDTIYSQLHYYKIPLDAIDKIGYWSSRYAHHLIHWLIIQPSEHQLNVVYKSLKEQPTISFQSICNFLFLEYDEQKFLTIYKRLDKKAIKKKTSHDKQVINLSLDYETNRIHFRQQQGELIRQCLEQACKNSGLRSDSLNFVC